MMVPLEFGTGFLAGCCPEIRQLYAYWDAKRGDKACPARRDLDPLDIPNLLPGIVLAEVVSYHPLDLIYRVVGTHEVVCRGSDPTGKLVSEAFHGESMEQVLFVYQTIVDRKEPAFLREPVFSPRKVYVNEENLFLPLSDDGETVNRVLVYVTDLPINDPDLALRSPE